MAALVSFGTYRSNPRAVRNAHIAAVVSPARCVSPASRAARIARSSSASAALSPATLRRSAAWLIASRITARSLAVEEPLAFGIPCLRTRLRYGKSDVWELSNLCTDDRMMLTAGRAYLGGSLAEGIRGAGRSPDRCCHARPPPRSSRACLGTPGTALLGKSKQRVVQAHRLVRRRRRPIWLAACSVVSCQQ